MKSGLKFNIMNMQVDKDSGDIDVINTQGYDFVNDEIIEIDRVNTPNKVVPQDNLRYSIINIIAYCISSMINDYMEKYTMNSNSYNPEHHKCFIIMKNEFLK